MKLLAACLICSLLCLPASTHGIRHISGTQFLMGPVWPQQNACHLISPRNPTGDRCSNLHLMLRGTNEQLTAEQGTSNNVEHSLSLSEPTLEEPSLLMSLLRTKRHSHLSLCSYCCSCCKNKGCGYCCRT